MDEAPETAAIDLPGVPERRSGLRAHVVLGLTAGALIAPALWLAPQVVPAMIGVPMGAIVTSWAQFVTILIAGLVLGPMVTTGMYVVRGLVRRPAGTDGLSGL